jgi:hypothetical protein
MHRIGFHYHNDAQHYTRQDLEKWLPELQALGATWLILNTPKDRAIPETFISSLLEAGITPVLHFILPPDQPAPLEDLHLLFENYARWGVKYALLFDKPNLRVSWSTTGWVQRELVERFLDAFTPLARSCLQTGLTPVFPPLEPGGDFWDTIFLRRALEGLQRRGHREVLDKWVLSAYARTGEHSLNWGAGGPERWPGVLPYAIISNEEDQRGFRIFDWYQAITKAILGTTRPIILLGLRDDEQKTLVIARLLAGETVPEMEPLPEEVLVGAFEWNPTQKEDADPLAEGSQAQKGRPPLRQLFRQWAASSPKNGWQPQGRSRFIDHYLLLPSFEWGVADFHLEAIRPFVKKHQPTIGFSLSEAIQAHRVTVIGGTNCFSDEVLSELRTAGCIVERIAEDGIELASKLASL